MLKHVRQNTFLADIQVSFEMLRGIAAVFVCFTAVLFQVALSQTSDSCTAPNNESGTCMELSRCPSVLSILTKKPLTDEDVALLRQYHCGFTQDKAPRVCCPAGGLTQSNWTSLLASKNLLNKQLCTFASDRLIGSDKANIDEYPWTALLNYQNSNNSGFQCNGVLLNGRYVLTAAHCVAGNYLLKHGNLRSIRLGENNLDTDLDCYDTTEECVDSKINVDIEQIIVHENYSPNDTNQYNDIALIRLSKRVNFTAFVSPICLPFISNEIEDGERKNILATLTGWGENGTISGYKWKHSFQFNKTNHDSCSSDFKTRGINIGEEQICYTEVNSNDRCRTTNGVSLVVPTLRTDDIAFILRGIESFSSPCTNNGRSNVFTKINYKYVKWIVDHIEA